VEIGIDCIGTCKFNYHTITTTTVPITFDIYLFINRTEQKTQKQTKHKNTTKKDKKMSNMDHTKNWELTSNRVHEGVFWIQHYMIKSVSDLRQIGGFLRVHRFLPAMKLTATI
jgi:hypothetical protein